MEGRTVSSASTRSRYGIAGACLAVAALAAAAWGWHLHARAQRPRYVLVNETGRHDFDLALRMSLKLAEKKSGIENALVLLASLPPSRTIEETASDYFSRLRIGERRNGRGILYLYSARENLLKIEVSYALEGDIPDAYCRRLEEAARTYMLSEVPQDFISELIITTNLRGMGSREAGGAPSRPEWLSDEFLSGGGGALIHGYSRTLADYQRAVRHLAGADLKGYEPSTDPQTTLRRYLASLEAGIGDPRLPLLTEGSGVFRAVVPRGGAQLRRIFDFLQAASPLRLLVSGGLALAVPQPGHSNLPVVLRRGTDGLWYVDEPKAWTYFHRFEDEVDFHVKFADDPFLPGLRALRVPRAQYAIYGDHVRTPSPPAYPFSLSAAVGAMEARIAAHPDDAAAYAALGDLYLFEMDWLTRSIEMYEKASALAPDELSYRWRLVDLYLNASRADKFLAELEFLSRHSGNDPQARDWFRFYKAAYDFDRP
ncbi:MAG TPA: TPM domain-containing protein [Usitatibacter sp.]|nr:TPM domain-containing protein [Usitatibacter sp.]